MAPARSCPSSNPDVSREPELRIVILSGALACLFFDPRFLRIGRARSRRTCCHIPLRNPSLTAIGANSYHETVYDSDRRYYVYILVSKSPVLYIGITRHLAVRIAQHKAGSYGAFTAKYGVY